MTGYIPRGAVWAAAALSLFLGSQSLAADAEFGIISDQTSTAGAAELCLAVDSSKPIVPDRGAQVIPPAPGAQPLPISGTFYPVVTVRCDTPGAGFPSKWTFSDTRELRIKVNGASMCVSARFMTSFEPLLDPFLKAFHAFEPDSPFAYLAAELKPGGKINAARLHASPDLVVSICGRTDATDLWTYDEPTGTISGPAGWDDKGPRTRQCVAMHVDTNAHPPKHDPGMPVTVASCPDLWSFNRSAPADRRWHITSGKYAVPTYTAAEPHDYFNGAGGLPIVGPMGRCLTADFPLKIAVTSDCDGRQEQDWRINGDIVQLGPKGDCLTRAADQTATLSPCTNAANQRWTYIVRDPVPNPGWRNADVFGQTHPKDNPDQCLVVSEDPFVDPIRQRNVVKVAACSSVLPRQTSWFRSEAVRTIRIALLRDSDDDGSRAALGKMTDDDARRTMEEFASRLSAEYHVLGVRFVFDPNHDYLHVKDSVANRQLHDGKDAAPTDWEPENHNVRIAANDFYGKAVIVVTANFLAGGFSSANLIDFDLARALDPISRGVSFSATHQAAGIPKDKAGLLAFSYYIGEAGIGVSVGDASHHAHEFGHYLSLQHTFQPDDFADTPDDTGGGSGYYPLGSTSCGNSRAVKAGTKTVTPDRNNNEGYWGCTLGRSRNSFSPLQLGKANWVLQNQLNRYPLVACQPVHNYDADHLECENAESLELCRQTADYLKKKTDTSMECAMGGRYARIIATALQYPAVLHLLHNTPAGRSLVNKLAGLPARDSSTPPASFDAVVEALKAGKNLALTMAVVNRIRELQDMSSQRNPSLAKSGFVANAGVLGSGDQQALSALSGQVITPAFIANVPPLITH